jgi:hypothetical protein
VNLPPKKLTARLAANLTNPFKRLSGQRPLLWAVILYFAILLAIPGHTIFQYYYTLITGELYKIQVSLYDPYDPFRGRYAAIFPVNPPPANSAYAVLDKDPEGFAIITSRHDTKPTAGTYVKNLEISRYYMNEKQAPQADRLLWDIDPDKDLLYVTVAVRDGRYVIKGMYLNDIPIETYLDTAIQSN